jgi:hypothetical protein
LLDEAADPPGPLDAAAPPPVLPPPLDEAAPPLPELLVPPVAPALPESLLAEPGVLGVVLEDEDDEPPGTTIVSRSFVVVDDVADPLGAAVPPGTTVVVSLRSQAERARAPIRTNR